MEKAEDDWSHIPFISDEDMVKSIQDSPFLSSDRSKSTVINQVKQGMYFTESESIYDYLTHPAENGIKFFDDSVGLNKRYNCLKSALSVMRTCGWKSDHTVLYNVWYKWFVKASSEQRDVLGSNKANKRQRENAVDWEDVIRIRDELPYGSMDHVLLSMYTMIPPRRQLDYARMRVYMNPEEEPDLDHNMFHLNSKRVGGPFMFLNEFKNAKFFNTYFNKYIGQDLVNVVKKSMEMNPRNYLFGRKDGFPYENTDSYQSFSNGRLKKIFDKPGMSVNVLRHSFASYVNKKRVSLRQLKIYSYQMGHALIKHLEYVHHDDEDGKKEVPKKQLGLIVK